MSHLDAQKLRAAFGTYMTGVTVVTTRRTDGEPIGFTANSFTSVSMDPPLLLVCPGRFLSSFDAFRACSHFAVSVLAEGQEEVSNTFAGFKGDRFAQVQWSNNDDAIPLINGAAAQFSCRTEKAIDAGDHIILLGAVEAVEVSGRRGLGYSGGQYFSLGLERGSIPNDPPGQGTIVGAIIERNGHVLLQESPRGYRVPQTRVSGRTGLRLAVTQMLDAAGHQSALGATYSIYDDRATGLRHIYFLGRPVNAGSGGSGHWQAIETLKELNFADPALAAMMSRYSEEFQTRTFGLYLGDDHSGDLAPLQERT